MIFGYTIAVVAGFLLTAVRNWTERPTPAGGYLAAMVALWLFGRILPVFSEDLANWFIALVDLAFLPVVAIGIGVPLVRRGGVGVLTLGMMARVSLGHTGRPLNIGPAMVGAFGLVNLSAVTRGLLPIVLPEWFSPLIVASGLLWIAAFVIFVVIYTPILTQPRIDGRPG